ncbi:VF530 family DNA-binding protein [Kangiella taiwanensis]|uniref:VF530 family DNA-binding protein n=1 Tax=Kangiella taiwanensis TaxID=1079179 RepID=A0ABP8I1Q8_9GAMM|nr:VF530 family protein [Kangiella taiwanensis]
MSEEINYKNNPLNGVGLKALVTELVEHYGFEILHAYLNLNCFKTNPSVESSVKFLKKTDWAREKVEAFYMYQYKSLPPVSSEQFHIPPRDRIVSDDENTGEPAKLSLEDAEQQREKRAKKAAEYQKSGGHKHKKSFGQSRTRLSSKGSAKKGGDPWGGWKTNSED